MNDRKRLLELALKGLQVERDQLSRQITEIEAELRKGGGRSARTGSARVAASVTTVKTVAPSRKRRKMSAAARKKLSEAAKRRWEVSKKAGKKTL